jgi:hypothetical protein
MDMVKHNYCKSVSELLVRFLTMDESYENMNAVQDFSIVKFKIYDSLITRMGPQYDYEVNYLTFSLL